MVTLDKRGRLSDPPTILRRTDRPVDEPLLRAEASALAALALCMPQGDARFGGKTYRLDFLPSG